jgi:hypothetical protein
MRKHHHGPQSHILRAARPGLDKQVRPVLEVPEGLAPARGEEGGGVGLVYSVWEEEGEVRRVGRTGVEAGGGLDGGVPCGISGYWDWDWDRDWDEAGLNTGSCHAAPRSATRTRWGCDMDCRR